MADKGEVNDKDMPATRSSLSLMGLLGILAFGLILIHKMSKKHQQEPGYTGPPTDHSDHPPKKSASGISPIETVRVQPESQDKDWETEQKELLRKQVGAAISLNKISIVAGIIAVLYAIITYLLWQQNGSNFRNQQRSWVGITEPMVDSLGFERPNLFVIHGHFSLRNYGQSPALTIYPGVQITPEFSNLRDVAYSACVVSKDALDRAEDAKQPDIKRTSYTVFPGDGTRVFFDAGTGTTLTTEPPNPYIMICSYYRDIFGKLRHTWLCFFSPQGKTPHELRPCPWYNEVE